MNQKELYDRAINRIATEKENEEQKEARQIFDAIAHNKWKEDQYTQQFYKWLQSEYDKCIVEAQNLATSGNSKHAARKLIRAKTIEDILNYGR